MMVVGGSCSSEPLLAGLENVSLVENRVQRESSSRSRSNNNNNNNTA